ncbi:MAG TPA: Uma2 family endonuclease [Aggregatilineales bacterium]|nr:Uma2 family endonuclease [Aggregatilineales bacterium]
MLTYKQRNIVRMTEAEYLAFDRVSQTKHELFNGEVYAMAGASERHNRITGNAYGSLWGQITPRSCSIYASDMRIRIPNGNYAYPDGSALCGPPDLMTDELDILLNPSVIIEVLSSSTESFDQGNKFTAYRAIPSLMEYILIAQDHLHVELRARQADGSWVMREYIQPDDRIHIPSIDAYLALTDVYRNVFPVAP